MTDAKKEAKRIAAAKTEAKREYRDRFRKSVLKMKGIVKKRRNKDDKFRQITAEVLLPARKVSMLFYVDLFNAAFDMVYGV